MNEPTMPTDTDIEQCVNYPPFRAARQELDALFFRTREKAELWAAIEPDMTIHHEAKSVVLGVRGFARVMPDPEMQVTSPADFCGMSARTRRGRND